jgi:hypothetical protein
MMMREYDDRRYHSYFKKGKPYDIVGLVLEQTPIKLYNA